MGKIEIGPANPQKPSYQDGISFLNIVGAKLYAFHNKEGTLYSVDLNNNNTAKPIEKFNKANNIKKVGDLLYISTDTGLKILDPNNNSVIDDINLDFGLSHFTYSESGDKVYYLNFNHSLQIYKINTRDNERLQVHNTQANDVEIFSEYIDSFLISKGILLTLSRRTGKRL